MRNLHNSLSRLSDLLCGATIESIADASDTEIKMLCKKENEPIFTLSLRSDVDVSVYGDKVLAANSLNFFKDGVRI